MKEKIITLSDSTKLYTRYSLKENAKAIIMVHGGPGNGIWDLEPFMNKLAEKYSVIAFDQRGVNKSDAIQDGFNSEMLIDDIDEVRRYFGIDRAILIGHSYGGHLLLRYSLKYPQQVEKAVFLCPSFDFADSFRTVCLLAYDLLKEKDFAQLDELKKDIEINTFESTLAGLMMIPEEGQNHVYGYDNIPQEMMQQVMPLAPSQQEMEKSALHQQAVFSEGELCKDHTDKLKELAVPSLLIVGDRDPVCTEKQIAKYRENAKNGQIVIIKNSAHFPYMDAIVSTVKTIEDFAK